MKFLHIADLHLGRRLNDLPLLEDQKALLGQIIEIAVSEAVDGMLIAGDIYNKSVPGSDAMTVFDDFLTALSERGIKIYMISGNHDSDERISYFSKLIRQAGIYTTEAFDGSLQRIRLEDEHGPLVIHMMPFIRPIQIRRFYPDREIVTYEDAVRAVIENSEINANLRNVLICHQFIIGAEVSDSEEFAVGGLDAISASAFDAFDYVALGHLHKPQKVKRDTIRYAGSPMKYSLSEANHKKSVTIVELLEKGSVEIRQMPLHAPHDVREVTGTMAEIMEMDYSEDYISVVLTDEMVPPDAGITVSTVFPNMIKLTVRNSRTADEMVTVDAENIEDKSMKDLFFEFYRMQNGGVEPEKTQIDIIEGILKELEEEKYETD